MLKLIENMKDEDRCTYRKWMLAVGFGYGLIFVFLVGLILYDTRVANWASDSAQAESVGPGAPVASDPIIVARRTRP